MGAVVAAGRGRDLIERLKDSARTPGALLLGATLVFMAASLGWSLAPARGATYLAQIIGTVAIVGTMLACVCMRHSPLHLPREIGVWLAIGIGATAAIILAEAYLATSTSQALALPSASYRKNRAALAIVLLLPITLVLLARAQRRGIAIALAFAGVVGVFASESEAAKLGLGVALATAALAYAVPRLTHRAAGLAVLIALAGTPLAAAYVNELIPRAVHDFVGYGVLTIRGEIWREFADLVWQRPFIGFGIESSNAVARSSYAVDLSDAARRLLNQGHPHNAALQIWFELGLLGAMLTAALLSLAWWRIEALANGALTAATSTAVAAASIAFVSHGAWQAWWYCLGGLVLVLFVALDRLLCDPASAVHRSAARSAPTV